MQQDFAIVNNVTLNSLAKLFIDESTGKYDALFVIGDAKATLPLLDLRQLSVNFEQIGKANPDRYANKALDLKLIVAKLESILAKLEEIRLMGALLGLDGYIPSSETIEIEGMKKLIIKITAQAEEKRTDHSSLDIVEEGLLMALQEIKKENQELSTDLRYNWILRLFGLQKECLAKYFVELRKNEKTLAKDLAKDAGNIVEYLFEDKKKLEELSKKARTQNFDECKTTSSILKLVASNTESRTEHRLTNKVRKIKYGGFETNKHLTLISYLSRNKIENFTPMQFLLLNNDTSEQEIGSFLEAAFADTRNHYIMMDLHLLPPAMRNFLIKTVKEKLNADNQTYEPNTNIMIFVKYRDPNRVYAEFDRYRDYVEQVDLNAINHQAFGDVEVHKDILKLMGRMELMIVDSDIAGVGKSHWVRQQTNDQVVNMVLSGEINPVGLNKRLEIVSKELVDGKALLIKLDMMENMMSNAELVDQQLFKICFLRCIMFKNSFMFFKPNQKFFIEIGNNYRESLLKGMPFLAAIISQTKLKEKMTKTVPPIDFGKPKDFSFDSDIQTMVNTICKIYRLYKENKYSNKNLQSFKEWTAEIESF